MGVDDGGGFGIVVEKDVKGDGILVGGGDEEVFDFLHGRGFGEGWKLGDWRIWTAKPF